MRTPARGDTAGTCLYKDRHNYVRRVGSPVVGQCGLPCNALNSSRPVVANSGLASAGSRPASASSTGVANSRPASAGSRPGSAGRPGVANSRPASAGRSGVANSRPASAGSRPGSAGRPSVPNSAPAIGARPASACRHVDAGNRDGIVAEAIVEASALGSSAPDHDMQSENPQIQLERLWEHIGVPHWHREFYRARFFCDTHRPGVLLREIAALMQGRALVQEAMRAIDSREACLRHLARLRETHSDKEFLQVNSEGRRLLIEDLVTLREATVTAVHALTAWRQSVGPLPGAVITPRSGELTNSCPAVAGPSARGVIWPWPPAGKDYIWVIAHNDEVIQYFKNVLQLSPLCDPFLQHVSSESLAGCGKIPIPLVQSMKATRIEAAKMQLLEDEITLAMFVAPPKTETPNTIACSATAAAKAVSAVGTTNAPEGTRGFMPVCQPTPASEPTRLAACQARPSSMLDFAPLDATRTQRHLSNGSCYTDDGSMVATLSSQTSGQVSKEKKASLKPPDAKRASQQRSGPVVRSRVSYNDTDPVSKPKAPRGEEFFQTLRYVFNRYAHDGCIHRDDMVHAMEAIGVIAPVEEWVHDVFKQVTNYNTVELNEFVVCLDLYDETAKDKYEAEFKRYDEDDSGLMDVDELAMLLDDLGIQPMSHVLHEIIQEVDVDSSGTLNIEEFYHVMKVLNEREGFDKAEYSKFLSIFHKFDFDGSNAMDTHEFQQALSYMGYRLDNDIAKMIIEEVDHDDSGTLSSKEFISCMRRVREHEVTEMKDMMRATDEAKPGSIDSSKVVDILRALGYFPDRDVIAETCEDVGIDQKGSDLDISTLWIFISKYREKEGLSCKDIEDIQKVCERYGEVNKDGALQFGARIIGSVLRFMGFWMPFDQHQLLVQRIDVDGSGALLATDLHKLVRMCRENDMQKASDMFAKYCRMYNKNEIISKRIALEALVELGYDLGNVRITSDDMFPSSSCARAATNAVEHDFAIGIDLHSFLNIARRNAVAMRDLAQQFCGFSREEVAEMKKHFAKYDTDGSGDISKKELASLVQTCLPDMTKDPKQRPKLISVLQSCNVDADTMLGFDEFLNLMRFFREQKEIAAVEKEETAVRDTGFESSEIQEFREHFLSHARKTDYKLEFPRLCDMLGMICPLGERNIGRLQAKLRTITQSSEESVDELDFATFLRLWRTLLDCNFANILERTRAIVSKDAKEGSANSNPRKPIGENVDPDSASRRRMTTASSGGRRRGTRSARTICFLGNHGN